MNDRRPDPDDAPRGGVGVSAPGEGGRLRLLFVCTGNTCRSPMAEVIARSKVEERGWQGVEVRSAGVGAFPGAGPSGGGVRAAAAHGLDLSGHRATLLTRREVEWADLILTMSPTHLERVRELGGGDRAALLASYAGTTGPREPGSVPDPIGGTDDEYRETYDHIDDLIEALLDRLERGRAR